jgi:hypothetical protein
MLISVNSPNHPSVTSHRSPGHLLLEDDSLVSFDELLYFEDVIEDGDLNPPYYYIWNKADNFRTNISISRVKMIHFVDRIPMASI